MTVLFRCPQAPEKRVRRYDDGSEVVEVVSTLPSCEFSNANTSALLIAIGEAPAVCGDWAFNRLPEIQRILVKLVNGAAVPTGILRAKGELLRGAKLVGTGNVVELRYGPREFEVGGLGEEGVRSRAASLLEVVAAARRFGGSVAWDG